MIKSTGFARVRVAIGISASAIAALAASAGMADGPGASDNTVAQVSEPKVSLGVYDPHGTFGDSPEVAIEHIFMPWKEVDWATLQAADEYAARRGRDLLISVEPWSWSGKNTLTKETLAEAIALGEFDAEIDSFCQAAGGLASRATIRWGHEMDDTADRYTWSGLSPENYVNAYRYFVTQCRKSAPQASFMWSPKGEPNAASYYPGDAYVDSVGISVFGLQAYDREELGRDRGFRDAMRERYDRVAGFGKPVVAAEFGFSGESNYLGLWAAEMTCSDEEFPQLEAIVYFNDVETHPWPGAHGTPDWRVTPDLFERECEEQSKPKIIAGVSDTLLRSTTQDLPAGSDTDNIVTSSITPAAPAVAASQGYPEVEADDSVPMLAWELAQLYGGKSWIWSEGAGYLAADRKFLAWSGSGADATVAKGRWLVTDGGRMCFKAVWHAKSGSGPNTTCFSHRKVGSTILQKKEPSGQWYVFRSSEPAASDEYSKLRNGDEVSATLGQVQQNLQIPF